MKRILLGIILALFSVSAHAQSLTGQLTTASSTCGAAASSSIVVLQSAGTSLAAAAYGIAGTWMGTVTFYATANRGATWTAFSVTPSDGSAPATTATGNGNWNAIAGAYNCFCAAFTTATSGTASVTITLSTSGGGGGGAIVSCSTAGGVLYQNGTANTLSCNANFNYSPTGTSLLLSQSGTDAAALELNFSVPGSPLAKLAATNVSGGALIQMDAAAGLAEFGWGGNNFSTAIDAAAKATGFPLASAGTYRLSKAGSINWRNNADSGDVGWSLSGSDVLAANTPISAPVANVGSVSFTPNQSGLPGFQVEHFTLSAAQLISLTGGATEITVIPSPGPGKIIVGVYWLVNYIFNTAPFVIGNPDNGLYFNFPGLGTSMPVFADFATGTLDQVLNQWYVSSVQGNAGASSAAIDQPLVVSLQGTTPALSVGGGHLDITIWYSSVAAQ